MHIIDQVNLAFYEELWADETHRHNYPNINTVRCESWYFRAAGGRPGRLLDYGHGCGQEAAYFARHGYQVQAVDISRNANALLVKQLQGPFADVAHAITPRLLREDDARLPFEDAFFDYISSTQVIYHLPDEAALETLVREWHRVLRPGGKLMFSTIGPGNSLVEEGRLVARGRRLSVYEHVHPHDIGGRRRTLRCLYIDNPEDLRALCAPFLVDEVGWYSNHYCGIDGFHWQVLARKADGEAAGHDA